MNHAVALIFYWAALYERLLRIECSDLDWLHTEAGSASLLMKYLPTPNKNNSKLVNSNWRFIESYKSYISKPSSAKVFDTGLYEAIYNARLASRKESQKPPKKELDQDSIERQLKKLKEARHRSQLDLHWTI